MSRDGRSAEALVAAALEAVATSRWEEAGALFGRAAARRRAQGRPDLAARAVLGQASCRSEVGDLAGARDLLARARRDAPDDDLLLATIDANEAVVQARAGDGDGAAERWRAAGPVYLAHGLVAEAAGCLHNIALSLYERGRFEEALREVGRARELLAERGADGDGDGGTAAAASCDSTASTILRAMGEGEAARNAARIALAGFEAAGRPGDVARTHGILAVLHADAGDEAAAQEHLDTARPTFVALGHRPMEAASHELGARLRLAADDLDGAVEEASAALRLHRALDRPLGTADAHHNLSVVMERHIAARGEDPAAGIDHAGAVGHAVAAFDLVDRYRYGLDRHRDRHQVSVTHLEPIILNALEVAVDHGDPATAARLVERARMSSHRPTDATHPLLLGTDEVGGGAPPPAAVFRPDDDLVLPVRPPPALDVVGPARPGHASLPDAIVRSGGPEAWWWGMWLQRGRLFWCVRDPDGRIDAGRSAVAADLLDAVRAMDATPTAAENDAARRHVEDPVAARATARLLGLGRLAAGPLLADPATLEEVRAAVGAPLAELVPAGAARREDLARVGAALGEAILPPPLAAAVRAGAQRVVVSVAAGLAGVPLGLLLVPGTEDFVVQRATLSALTPVTAVEPVAPGRRSDEAAAVHVCISDPTADLVWADAGRASADQVLTGRSSDGHPLATRAAVGAALRRRAEGPGLLVYQGHVGARRPGEPATAALHLTPAADDDGLLSADQMRADPGSWPLPSDALIDACGSLGAGDAVEWAGLATTFLDLGCARVTATIWPLLDRPEMRAVTAAVVDALCRPSDDPAAELARVQRQHLDEWLAGIGAVAPHHFATHLLCGVRPAGAGGSAASAGGSGGARR